MNITNETATIAYLFGVLIPIPCLAFIAKLLWDEHIDESDQFDDD